MGLLRKRAKLVTFRLTDEEYDYFRAACEGSGRGSMSDFARKAALDFARLQTSGRRFLTEDLSTIAVQLEDLSATLFALGKQINDVLGHRKERNGKERIVDDPDIS